ncbi:MAG: hypothetical protein A4E28_00370 [Methanocella sp. PtaU1.Bin125]|nr:MAG: hypothetical protein A4E28_00370 [Methanocella sp. PtaU1.Bin125]
MPVWVNDMADGVPVNVHKIKEPLLAALLTLLLSGLGQIYNGQVKKGIVFLLFDIVAGIALAILIFFGSFIAGILTIWAGGIGMCCCIPMAFVAFVWRIYFAYDAYKTAGQINQGVVIYDWFN